MHGGAWVAFADTVAAWGTIRNLSEAADFTTVELKTNVFAAARSGDVLEAVGRPLHRGRSTQVWQVLNVMMECVQGKEGVSQVEVGCRR